MKLKADMKLGGAGSLDDGLSLDVLNALYDASAEINKKKLADWQLKCFMKDIIELQKTPPLKTFDQATDALTEVWKAHQKFINVVFANSSVLSFKYVKSVYDLKPSAKYVDLSKLTKAPGKKPEALKNNEMIDYCCWFFHLANGSYPTYRKEDETTFSKFLGSVAEALNFKVRPDRVIKRIKHFKEGKEE